MFEIKNIYSSPFDLNMTEIEHQNKVVRNIIKIDEDLCTGCGNCIVDCAEAALEIIDGKAKVVNDFFCDGLGACIQGCPEGALEIIEREAAEFDEEAVEKRLESLKSKEQVELEQVKQIVAEHSTQCGCPSSQTMVFDEPEALNETTGKISSTLRQWPVQMHLINPNAPYYQGADVLISADCVAYSYGDFHREFLKSKSIAIHSCYYGSPMLFWIISYSTRRRKESNQKSSDKICCNWDAWRSFKGRMALNFFFLFLFYEHILIQFEI